MTRNLIALFAAACMAPCLTARAQIVADGGFEAGTPNPFWEEFSKGFASPICNTTRCGTFFGGPNQGDWWVWFGGPPAFEVGSMSQEVTIPLGTATLRFWLDITSASGNGTDFMTVSIDGEAVLTVLESDQPNYHPWTQVIVDISQFADGGPHLLSFDSTTRGGGSFTNFFLDDVEITVEAGCDPCDMNCDGVVDALDIEPFIDILFNNGPRCEPCTGDTNGDGRVDAGDIEGFIECLFP